MKISLAGFLCLFFGFGVFAQTSETVENSAVKVESIALMRDDGAGKPEFSKLLIARFTFKFSSVHSRP
jgi:hypothetical protein